MQAPSVANVRGIVRDILTGEVAARKAKNSRELFGDSLREGDVMAGGILEANFAHAVESGALRLGDPGIFQRGKDEIEIVDFDVKKGRALLRSFEDQRHVVAEAGKGLVHDFGRAVLEGDEAELVAVRDFDGLGEAEPINPESEDGFDCVDDGTGTAGSGKDVPQVGPSGAGASRHLRAGCISRSGGAGAEHEAAGGEMSVVVVE
jgi:hypothetical protein